MNAFHRPRFLSGFGLVAAFLALGPGSGLAAESAGGEAIESPETAALVARAAAAHGGRERLLEFPGFRALGEVLSSRRGVNGTIRLTISRAGSMRSRIRYPGGPELTLRSGPLAWRGVGPRPDAASDGTASAILFEAQAWAAPFELVAAGPGEIAAAGKSEAGRDRLRREDKHGRVTEYELDPATGRVARVRGTTGEGDDALEVVIDLRDWREVEGIVLPFRSSLRIDGRRVCETILERVEREPDLPGSLFLPKIRGGDL
jgi:hypothetical protein